MCTSAHAAELTPTEATWLAAAQPVLQFAARGGLPLDVVVQLQPTPGETPLGMAYVDGRCALVLSMRGNAEAQATLDRIDADLRGAVVEAIAAHELAHCWRHVSKTWGTLPAGLAELDGLARLSAEQAELLRDMWRTRREEAFADLVGLAWTLAQHPDRYADVLAWNLRLRARQAIPTGPHDTRDWVRLATDPALFEPTGSVFERVQTLWLRGLQAGPAGLRLAAESPARAPPPAVPQKPAAPAPPA
jgi:hypothetical protein